jgi:hypothetical protein
MRLRSAGTSQAAVRKAVLKFVANHRFHSSAAGFTPLVYAPPDSRSIVQPPHRCALVATGKRKHHIGFGSAALYHAAYNSGEAMHNRSVNRTPNGLRPLGSLRAPALRHRLPLRCAAGFA